MALSWRVQPAEGGLDITCISKGLLGRERVLPIADWPSADELEGAGYLRYLVDAEEANALGDAVRIPHALAAAMTEDQAVSIDLPPSIPYALQVDSNGRLDEAGFGFRCRWMRFGSTPVAVTRQGAVASSSEGDFRVPAKLYAVLEAVEAFNEADTADREARLAHWAPVQDSIEAATGAPLRPDGYLEDLRIFQAASLSLSVDMRAGGISFEPVLFSRSGKRPDVAEADFGDLLDAEEDEKADDDSEISSRAGRDTLADEGDALLPADLQEVFLRERFDRDEGCRSAYPLTRNTYLIIDEPLRLSLEVVKQKRTAPEAERRAFLKNPRAAFAEALDIAPDAPELGGLFIETRQYADRITGIGLWEPKILPWLPKSPTSWLPEKFGLRLGNQTYEVAPESLPELRNACEGAMMEGVESFDHQSIAGIPASEETLSVIGHLEFVAARMAESGEEAALEDAGDLAEALDLEDLDEPSMSRRVVLEQEENIEELRFSLGMTPRHTTMTLAPPEAMIDPSLLFPHQREGFNWMLESWRVGRPGVLLADDMGLGKTLQTLAFASWLHQHWEARNAGKRGPILIVAPTALLRNWRTEHDKYLRAGGISPIDELYGRGLAGFRRPGARGRDTVAGESTLDREALGQCACILTTYETLANYHLSFAAVSYPLVIFDEIQKLKTPTTINTHAAKTINADFVIGLTGTPVENNLTELWSIMDRLHPGLFSDLRTFTETYKAEDQESLVSLRDALLDRAAGAPVMLRRMKGATDLGRALPQRYYRPLPREMPGQQASAYEDCIATARRKMNEGVGRGAMLKALHDMRSISLHPEDPKGVLGKVVDYEAYVAGSARLSAAFEVLDQIARDGEKVLVFIEFRGMQGLLADILRHRYQLSALPRIINGQTPSAKRQAYVDDFQGSPKGEFTVFILSPRAAGVGLNITAASHVIHLSRWWNPAVEDQCNDRAYRIGQDKEVTVYLPIARHPDFGEASFDVKLDALLTRKRNLSRDLLIPSESPGDYEGLFQDTVAE